MNRTTACRPIALAVLWFLPGASRAATVLTEDFESPDVSNYLTYAAGDSLVTATNTWFITEESIDLFDDPARLEAVAFDGFQAVDLAGSPGAGVMECTFPTVPGVTYDVTFHYARNDLLGIVPGVAQVEAVGATTLLQAQFQHDPALHAFNVYLTFSESVVADSNEAILRFASLNDGNAGITIDGISVSTTEPVGAGEPWESCGWSRIKGRFAD